MLDRYSAVPPYFGQLHSHWRQEGQVAVGMYLRRGALV